MPRTCCETGPWGLGLLRSAPAIGALAISIVLAHRQLEQRVGHVLFAAVGAFGAGDHRVCVLDLAACCRSLALAVYGAADAISVVIRHSLVQTRTPNEMLGRVMAVNFMFTGTSGTLGEFRAGAVAALFGAFTSVLVGGIGAIVVALLWMRLFPEIARIDTIQGQAGGTEMTAAPEPDQDDARRWRRRSNLCLQALADRCALPVHAQAGRAALADRAPRRSAPLRPRAPVRLSYRPVTMQSHRFITEIWSADNPKIQIASVSWRSLVEQERLDAAYSAFVAELHRRLAAAGTTARFSTGMPVAVYWIGVVVFAAVMVAMGVLIVRAMQAGQWTGAGIVGLFFVVFVYQLGNYFHRNRPGRYRPDALPANVLPRV